MDSSSPSAQPRYEKKKIAVGTDGGKQMAYVECGEGDPIVFLHGNPTSSYMWRNVMPHCEGLGARLVAPDMLGMGDSDKLDESEGGPDRYSLATQCEYLEAFLEALGLCERVTLVVHSWGATLGAYWASRHGDAMKGLVVMECAFTPLDSETMPPPLKEFVQTIRSPMGEKMVLEMNIMVEKAIQGGTIRQLSDAELDHYRQPFTKAGESRRPMLSFARAIPVDDEPKEVVEMMRDTLLWLEKAEALPKLLILGDPGSSMSQAEAERIRAWPNVAEATVPGKHLLTEDSPDKIGAAIAKWYQELP